MIQLNGNKSISVKFASNDREALNELIWTLDEWAKEDDWLVYNSNGVTQIVIPWKRKKEEETNE